MVRVHTHTPPGIFIRLYKKEILSFAATWTDLEGIVPSETNQTEKDNHHTNSLICGIQKSTKNKQKNEQTKPYENKHRDTENRVVVT